MKFRKVFSAIAATAVAISAAAASAAIASAADDPHPADISSTTITVNAADKTQLEGHAFTAVKLADYASSDAGYVSVTTVNDPQTIYDKVKAAAEANGYDESVYAFDPIAYISGVAGLATPPVDDDQNLGDNTGVSADPWAGAVRTFVNDLTADDTLKNLATEVALGNVAGTKETGFTADLAMPTAGLYLIFDVSDPATVTNPATTMLVGTAIKGASNKFVDETGTETEQWPATYMGTVTIKNNPVQVTSKFNFTLINVDEEGLAGGEFVIKNADGKYLKQEGAQWVPVDSAEEATKLTSDENGNVVVEHLPDGTYTIEQTKVPNDYLQSAKVTFEVTITDGKAAAFDETDAYDPDNDRNAEEEGAEEIADYAVKNYRNISQLPLTGGTGITMYIVMGLSLIGVAFVIQACTRAKRASRA
ncbi:SpaA isopeptide-forming pilin-related protein [Bifidobacterium pseudolongum]|uniref:SpaA isopeptide-forming pilin-related protein n=1 Tax=Bifidobacterium pseudolongum TaxID=1694 RepID=UPI0010228664|nr:SpaA isopeptide-forming pilin-related protein [Bifidobacterium pseudolongum]RYQ76038.1 hypothetical protein PG2012B_0085 [Bifidobacterium pseudolongum subsp. globosum]